jgi:UPF0755 protein
MKKLTILFIIILLVVAALLIWWSNGVAPVSKKDTGTQTFVVNKGAGIREIASSLKRAGLIKDPVVFFLLVKKEGLEKKIQAGSFKLSPSQSAGQIAKNLTLGTQDIWITIPEGKRAEEVAEILKKNLPLYNDSWVETLKENEGYLFPDTYLFPKESTVETVVNVMRGTFDSRFAEVENHTNLTHDQVVILASLIEREAREDIDRPIISSVIHNRLNIGMPLQIDATVQYALGYDAGEQTWWKKNLTVTDLKIDSPYNTYVVTGLPPGPIASPGLAVLKAAANPADTDYIFYITDKNGENHYAKTNAQHNANIKKYGL